MCDVEKTKKVVIRVDDDNAISYEGGLLPDFWLKEFCEIIKRKFFLYRYYDPFEGFTKCTSELSKEYEYSAVAFISSKDLGNNVLEKDINSLKENGTVEFKSDFEESLSREDETLIKIVEEIDKPKSIKVVEIPYDVNYYIYVDDHYNGESIVEDHRTWS